MTAKGTLRGAGFLALVAIIVMVSVFPLYYAVVTSLESGAALFEVNYLPAALDWSNYRAVFREQPFGRNILNSVMVATGVVLAGLALSVTASFALARIPFRGRTLLLMTLLAVAMFPQVAVLSGLFELVRTLGLYNSLGSLGLSYMIFTLPFTTWVLTAFMRDLPGELEEAAIMDGARPLAFIAAWNEFLFALTFTLTHDQRTVPVAIALISGASQYELPWGQVMAASVAVTVPLVLMVLVFQRRIVAGLTTGAIKG
jgi:trehalose/maltose transport system permease protein